MTKWVENKDVVFACQKDIWQYLIDENNAVRHKDKEADINILHFNNNGRIGTWAFYKYDDWLPMKRAEWYEDMPEHGVLCRDESGKFIIIACYKNGWFYSSSGGMYRDIRPVTKEEVLQYILPD